MRRWVVEAYVPRSRAGEAQAAGRRADAEADGLALEGVPVRYLRTTYLPDDETCFHVFAAADALAVGEVARRAALGNVRICAAEEGR